MFPSRRIIMGGDVFRDEYSLLFDGTDDYVEVADHSSLDITDKISFTGWFKSTDASHSWQGIVGKDDHDSGTEVMSVYIDDGGKLVARFNGASASRVYSKTALTDNRWYHFCSSYDKDAGGSEEHKLFVDGKQADTADYSTAINSNNETLSIGIFQSAAQGLIGNISEIAIYNTALTALQAKTLYNGREPYNHKEGIATGNLVSWWRMGDGILDTFPLIADQVNPTINVTEELGTADNDWDVSAAGWSISSGVISNDGAENTDCTHNGTTIGNFPLVQGAVYKLVFTISSSGSASLEVKCHNGTTLVAKASYTSGTYTKYIQEPGDGHSGAKFMWRGYADGDAFDITSYSVTTINGNAGGMINVGISDIVGDTP